MHEANLDSGSKEVYAQTDEIVTKHLSTMTDVSMEYVEALEKECMKSTNFRLESSVQMRDKWSKWFMSDENKVKFYTCLPLLLVLIVFFNFITTHGSRTRSIILLF